METEYKQGQSFTDTQGRTGTVNFDTKTGNRLGAGQSTFISTPTTGSITADTLVNPPKPLVVPPIQPPTYGGLEGTLAGTVATNKQNQATADQLKIEEAKKTSDTSLNSLLGAITESGTISSSVDRTEQDVAKKKSDFYTSQIEAEQFATRKRIEEIQKNNPTAALRGGQQDLIDNITRDSLSKQADLAILQTAANRDFDTAASIADRKVAMKMEASKAKIDALTLFYQDNKEQFTKLEQRQFESKLKEEQRAYEKKEAEEKAISSLGLNVAQNQAPQSIVQKALAAKSVKEIMDIPGISRYLLSPSERLDIQLKSMAVTEKANAIKSAEQAAKSGLITKDQAEKATELRKEYNSLEPVKSLDKSETDTKAILNALKGNKPTDDIAAINSFQRIAVDPGVSVREGDVALLQTANSFGDKAWLRTNGYLRGNKLTPAARVAMQDLVLKIHDSRIGSAVEKTAPIRAMANVYNVDFDSYVATPKKNSQQLLEEVSGQQIPTEQKTYNYVNSVRNMFGGNAVSTPFDTLTNPNQ